MKRERGQALAETALVAGLFAIFLLLFSAWARLTLCRLSLIALSRDFTVLAARNEALWSRNAKDQEGYLRYYAKRFALLDPKGLELSVKPLAPFGLGRLSPEAEQGVLGMASDKLLGLRRYTIRYRIQPRGLLGRFYPQGLTLEESLAVHGDPLKLDFNNLEERFRSLFSTL